MGIDGIETLVLPTHWAGETLHAMADLHAISKGAVLEEGQSADTKILHSPAGRSVVIGYVLKKDWTGPLINPMQFHPVLFPEYFEFTGSNALVAPKLDKRARETANFDWQKLPAAWTLATSFGTSASANDRCQTYTGPWIDIDQGLYAAGDFRIHTFQIGRRPAVLAIRGLWTFTDDEMIAHLQSVIGMVRNFWHDDNFPYFLVTMKPYDREHGSSDGSAFTNAFWMYASRLDSFSGLLPQLAHEAFHAWDPERMGIAPGESEEDSIKWFREGPTEYYAQLLTYKAGELTASDYVNSLNNALRKFPASSSEYVRGRIIALWLDATIRRESAGRHSLDDVMFDMVRDASQPYNLPRILATVERYLSAGSRDSFQRAVTQQGDLVAPERVPGLGACAHPSLQDLPTFDLGLDLARSVSTKLLSGVVEGGPAFVAGLRNGQSLVGCSVHNGDPDRMAKFQIRTGDGEKNVTFYPRGKPFAVWQYQLDPSHPCERIP